jgi:tripartite-type tricarboxylate transporter receptor subunit TctC
VQVRRTLKIAAGACAVTGALALAVAASLAQSLLPSWPAKQIQVIVPFSAGSATDVIPRAVLAQVAAQIGQSIVVENRVGAASLLGTAMVARADPDGTTLLATSNAIVAAPIFQGGAEYDPLRDFAGVAMFADVPLVLVIAPDKHIATVQELVAYGKAHPGALNYASAGMGSATHLPMERFRLASGWQGQHITFRGAPEALTEVMTGRVDIYFSPLTPALPLIHDGRLVPLAVAGAKRTAALPDVPTTLEAGYPDSDSDFWTGLYAPVKTPRAIVERLHEETLKALATPAVKDRLAALGAEPLALTLQQIDQRLAKESANDLVLAKAVGIPPTR